KGPAERIGVQWQKVAIVEAVPSMAGINALLKAARHGKRSRRGHQCHAKAAPVEICTCMGGLPDGHAKCCQLDALARQLPAPLSMQSGKGCGAPDSALDQWRDAFARDQKDCASGHAAQWEDDMPWDGQSWPRKVVRNIQMFWVQ
ncbi:hypothetical protein BDW02DRAFT_493762, partial [Decorospora gaudefroyi]